MLLLLKNWIKQRLSNLPDILLAAILGAILTTGTVSLFYETLWLYLKNILLLPTPIWTTIVLVLAFYIYAHLRTKTIRSKETPINTNDYKFIENPGYYTHKDKGGRYCHPCMMSGIASPLARYDRAYWRCLKCNTEIPIVPVRDY